MGRNTQFGPVEDEQVDYWNKHRREAQIIDNHFNLRKSGRVPKGVVKEYAVPRSQQVAIKENPRGGLPVFQGAVSTFNRTYQEKAQRFVQESSPFEMGIGSNVPYPEFDAGPVLQARTMMQQQNQPQQVVPTASPMCQLIEGRSFFSLLQAPSPVPLVRQGGALRGVGGRQFQIEGVSTCYCIDGLRTVDLQSPDPKRMMTLVKVSAPLLGTFMVPESAILQEGAGGGRQLLLDNGVQTRNAPNVESGSELARRRMLLQQQQKEHERNMKSLLLNNNSPSVPQSQVNRGPVPQQQRPMNNIQQQGINILKKRGLLRG